MQKKNLSLLKNNYGFSLVELSIVITIISITLGGALQLATQKSASDRINDTNSKIASIYDALIRFVQDYQRLPCPADGTLAFSDTNFGKEKRKSGDNSRCDNASIPTNGDNSIFGGVVPVRTLGLSDEMMIDGWNRRITYAVDEDFANSGEGAESSSSPNPTNPTNSNCDNVSSTRCFKYSSSSAAGITIKNTAGGTDIKNNVVVILISHGTDGRGAYKRIGSTTTLDAGTSDTSEDENSDFSSFDNVFVDKTDTATYDDIVFYKQKWDMISDSGMDADTSTTCDAAKNVYDNKSPSSNNTCTGLTGTKLTTCEQMSDFIYKICLNEGS